MKIFCNKEEERFLMEALENSGSCVIGSVNNCNSYKNSGCTSGDFHKCLNEKFKIEIMREKLESNELQCAACGFIGNEEDFYNSSVHSKFKICPKCGTIRFVCDENKGYVGRQMAMKNSFQQY